jgi:cell wall-associated NlpC family hydrolase
MARTLLLALLVALLACSVFAGRKKFAQALADEIFPLSDSFGAQCTSSNLNVRASPGTSGRLLRTLPQGSSVNVISTSNGWAQIGSGQYVSAQYLRACASPSTPSSGGSGQGVAAANWALSKVGGCYSQTRRDGNPCYDCSSLVYYAWKAAGKNIGATNTRMYPGNTRAISASQLQSGGKILQI